MLPLHRQGYTDAQVEAALRASTGFYGLRVDLLDNSMRLVGGLQVGEAGVTPVEPGTVMEATVQQDTTRKLAGSLDITMLPDERLRAAAYQYRLRPVFIVGPMPDGGVAEFNCGVYVWDIPERVLATSMEEWKVTLADGLYDLDSGGPGIDGFRVSKNEYDTDAIERLVLLSGMQDTTGVTPSAARFAGPRSWGLTRPRQAWGYMYMPNWDEGWGFFAHDGIISVGGQNPNQTRTTTLLDIAMDVQEGMGYMAPFMSWDGVYQARPAIDWTKARLTTTFGSDAQSITVSPISVNNDRTKVCNRVTLWNEGSDSANFVVVVDANDIVPGHPLSEAKIHRYLDKYITDSTADTQFKAEMQARAELLKGLASYQTLSFDTLAWPVLEPHDVIGVLVVGDTDYGSLQLMESTRVSFNLMTGVMSHEAQRVFNI